jgi:hypothetical protein
MGPSRLRAFGALGSPRPAGCAGSREAIRGRARPRRNPARGSSCARSSPGSARQAPAPRQPFRSTRPSRSGSGCLVGRARVRPDGIAGSTESLDLAFAVVIGRHDLQPSTSGEPILTSGWSRSAGRQAGVPWAQEDCARRHGWHHNDARTSSTRFHWDSQALRSGSGSRAWASARTAAKAGSWR